MALKLPGHHERVMMCPQPCGVRVGVGTPSPVGAHGAKQPIKLAFKAEGTKEMNCE